MFPAHLSNHCCSNEKVEKPSDKGQWTLEMLYCKAHPFDGNTPFSFLPLSPSHTHMHASTHTHTHTHTHTNNLHTLRFSPIHSLWHTHTHTLASLSMTSAPWRTFLWKKSLLLVEKSYFSVRWKAAFVEQWSLWMLLNWEVAGSIPAVTNFTQNNFPLQLVRQ